MKDWETHCAQSAKRIASQIQARKAATNTAFGKNEQTPLSSMDYSVTFGVNSSRSALPSTARNI